MSVSRVKVQASVIRTKVPSGSEKASVDADVKPKKENGFENTDSLPYNGGGLMC
jgi:hypothetical protein